MRILIALIAMITAMALAGPAFAEHPDDDDKAAEQLDGAPWWVTDRDNPACSDQNQFGEYTGMDWEIWVCWPEPGIPEVPGSAGWYWEPVDPGYADPDEPDPDSPDDLGGDVQWAVKWVPVALPGYPGLGMRVLTRSEWVNPTGAGRCPNVTGGCHMKGGTDIKFYRNGQPFQLNKTWFNRDMQLYVYNFTTHAWDLKQDTGWAYAGAAAATYLSSWTKTLDYGVAPYGDTWYWIRSWTRTWDGAKWTNTMLDPNPGKLSGHLGIVDPKPGESTDIPAPDDKVKPPKIREPKKLKDDSAELALSPALAP